MLQPLMKRTTTNLFFTQSPSDFDVFLKMELRRFYVKRFTKKFNKLEDPLLSAKILTTVFDTVENRIRTIHNSTRDLNIELDKEDPTIEKSLNDVRASVGLKQHKAGATSDDESHKGMGKDRANRPAAQPAVMSGTNTGTIDSDGAKAQKRPMIEKGEEACTENLKKIKIGAGVKNQSNEEVAKSSTSGQSGNSGKEARNIPDNPATADEKQKTLEQEETDSPTESDYEDPGSAGQPIMVRRTYPTRQDKADLIRSIKKLIIKLERCKEAFVSDIVIKLDFSYISLKEDIRKSKEDPTYYT